MASEVSWAIDSEPIQARGIIVKYTVNCRYSSYYQGVRFSEVPARQELTVHNVYIYQCWKLLLDEKFPNCQTNIAICSDIMFEYLIDLAPRF